MPKDRKAFNFYKSHWEQIKLVSDEQKLNLFNAICKVQFLEMNIDDVAFSDAITNLVWVGIKHSVSTSLNGFINKQKALGEDVTTPLAKGVSKPLSQGGAQQEKEKVEEEGKEEEKVKEISKDTGTKVPSFSFKNELLSLGVEKQIADDWLKVRSKKKAANTKTAFDGFKREISKSGLSPNECVQKAVENSWGGFKAAWIEPKTETGFSPGQKYYKKEEYSWD